MFLKAFRIIAVLEGISYLALFGITMPLKYWADIPGPNKWVGYIHGMLFITYIVLAFAVCFQQKWGVKKFALLALASLLPFATFYIEENYLKPSAA